MATIMAVGTPAVLVFVWLLRLEGRVDVNQALHNKLAEDVKYIRERIDTALNGHSK